MSATRRPDGSRLRFLAGGPWTPLRALGWAVVIVLAAAVLVFSARGVQFSFSDLAAGLPNIADILGRMWPPNWAFMQRLWQPLLETVELALWGTVLSGVLALPICFLAARNLSPHPVVFHATRQVLNAARGINEIIFSLIFVAAVGLGPFAGVLALSIHGAGMLGKFFAEAIEEVDPGPVNALRATGANAAQTVTFGILPQVLPSWVAAVLYRMEVNLRASTVLGIVGAGGLGFDLMSSLKLFQYQDTAVCVLVILAMVMSADYVSTRLRTMILR